MRALSLAAAAAMLATVAGCGTKPEIEPDFGNDLQAISDGKSDTISPSKLKIVGSLDYGQSASVKYTSGTAYLAYKFGGQPGDKVVIDVTSKTGDAVAWLADNAGTVIAKNDDFGN